MVQFCLANFCSANCKSWWCCNTMKICSWHWRPGPQKSWRWTLIKLKVDKMLINNKIKSWKKLIKSWSKPKKVATPTTPHPGRQRETTGDKTISEPKKATTPTNTEAARSKVALRTPTVNCLGKTKKIYIYICLIMIRQSNTIKTFPSQSALANLWVSWLAALIAWSLTKSKRQGKY